MMPKKGIIKKSSEFKRILSQGKKYKSENFIFVFIKNDSLSVGFCTEKGLKSTIRNRVKRITRELYRTIIHRDSIKGKIIIITKAIAALKKMTELKIEFEGIVAKIALEVQQNKNK